MPARSSSTRKHFSPITLLAIVYTINIICVLPSTAKCTNEGICGLVPTTLCEGKVSKAEAEDLCASYGGRLCTSTELKNQRLVKRELKSFSCQADDTNFLKEYLWTSTSCTKNGNQGSYIYRYKKSKKLQCEVDTDTTYNYFACCGEKDDLNEKSDSVTEDDGTTEDTCASIQYSRSACQSNPLCVYYFDTSPSSGKAYGCHAALSFCEFETFDQCQSRCNIWRCEWVNGSCKTRNATYPSVSYDANHEDESNSQCAILGLGETVEAAASACNNNTGCKFLCDRCRAAPQAQAASESSSQSKPNIIWSVADDLGWNDIGYHNNAFSTPTLDKLAGDGVKLDRHYQYRFCSPSRSMMLTGTFPWRYGQQTDINLNPYDSLRCGLQEEMTMLPELLKSAGYATHMVGKWHLGHFQTKFIPTNRGFDSFVGYFGGVQGVTVDDREVFQATRCSCPANNALTTCKWSKFTNCATARQLFNASSNSALTSVPRASYAEDYDYGDIFLASEAARVIRAHDQSSGPFFLYAAWDSPHDPHESPERFQATSTIKNNTCAQRTRRKVAGMANALDTANEMILEALKETGMWENTLFVFASDNGGHNKGRNHTYCPSSYDEQVAANNYPLRGSKFTFWEGGIRTAAFVAGGSNILPSSVRGTVYQGLISSADWFSTFLSAAGVESKQTQDGADSVDHWATLTSKKSIAASSSARTELPVQVWGDAERYVFIAQVEGSLIKLLRGYPGYLNGMEWLRPSKSKRQNNDWDSIHIPIELDTESDSEALVLEAAQSFKCESAPCLFNLTGDPSETTNLNGNADLLARMEILLEPYLSSELSFENSGLCAFQKKFLAYDTRAISQARRCGSFAPWLQADGSTTALLACPALSATIS